MSESGKDVALLRSTVVEQTPLVIMGAGVGAFTVRMMESSGARLMMPVDVQGVGGGTAATAHGVNPSDATTAGDVAVPTLRTMNVTDVESPRMVVAVLTATESSGVL